MVDSCLKEKVYKELFEWKEKYAIRSACLLEGASRVVFKSTLQEMYKNIKNIIYCLDIRGKYFER